MPADSLPTDNSGQVSSETPPAAGVQPQV
jgi:hypothetical protein